jgi:nucleoside-triphosphatase
VARGLLLTGRPGVGKATIVGKVVSRLGTRAGGFYSTESRERGRRTRFRLVGLDGSEGTLLSREYDEPLLCWQQIADSRGMALA